MAGDVHSSPGTSRPKPSAPYDGRRFQNPAGRAGNGLFHFLRWVATSKRRRWPKRIADHASSMEDVQPPPGTIAATFIGHSTFLLQLGGLNLLTDPVYSKRVGPWNLAGPRRVRAPGVPFEQLPRIDAVLLSHNHYDHMDLSTLAKLRRKFDPLLVTTLGNARFLRRRGFAKVVELDWWETHQCLPHLQVLVTPAQHFSSRHVFDRDRTLWGGFVISSGGQRVYFVGDSGYGEHFRQIAEKVRDIDLALIPIGAYEPRWFMRRAHVNPEEAVRIHLDVRPRKSVGMHFGTFQLTDEAIDDPPRHLREAMRERNVHEDEFVVPGFGERIAIPAR